MLMVNAEEGDVSPEAVAAATVEPVGTDTGPQVMAAAAEPVGTNTGPQGQTGGNTMNMTPQMIIAGYPQKGSHEVKKIMETYAQRH